MNMKSMLLILLAALSLPTDVSAQPQSPNILLICIDDLRPELGCYGASHVISPNIDRLSASGVTFDRCHVQVAVCNPSRASMLTGLRPDTLGCWTLRFHFRETKPEAVTLPQYLRQHGYTAEGYGKIFHNPWQDPQSWSRPHEWGGKSYTNYTDEQRALIEQVRKTLPDDSWQRDTLRGPITNDPDIRDEDHSDGAMAEKVVDRIRALKNPEQPFFLAAGFVLPHVPWCPPRKYWDMYDRDKLPLAPNPEPPVDAPAVALGNNSEFRHYADTTDLPAPLDGTASEAQARRYRHGYLAAVTFVDAQVGKILDALDQEGLADNTIVVLWADHGYKLGEHNGWGKMTNFEIDTRIPFIIRDPRAKANGQRSKRLIETLDIFPTVCELAGLPAPDFTEGHSAAGLLNNPDADHIPAAFSQYIYAPLIGNSIRTNDWRYTEWRQMSDGTVEHRELYDHRTDDGENRNVFAQHPEIAAELQRQLRETIPPHPVKLQPQIHSRRGVDKRAVEFVNRHPGPVRVSWINPAGARALVFDVAPGQTHKVNSYVGHVFVAESLDGRYHEILTIAEDHNPISLGEAVTPP